MAILSWASSTKVIASRRLTERICMNPRFPGASSRRSTLGFRRKREAGPDLVLTSIVLLAEEVGSAWICLHLPPKNPIGSNRWKVDPTGGSYKAQIGFITDRSLTQPALAGSRAGVPVWFGRPV